MAANALTPADVTRLLSEASAENRADLAGKVAFQIDQQTLTAEERAIAEDIVRALARDTAQIVRQALAISAKHTPHLPVDVARLLANDVDDVASPILEFSSVLSDRDLIEIVAQAGRPKLCAVSRRHRISGPLVEAIINKGDSVAAAELVGNEGAAFDEKTLGLALDRYGDAVEEPMVKRGRLPLTIAERLVVSVAEHLQDHLVTHHELSPDTASELLMRTRERATVDLLDGSASEDEALKLCAQLHRHRRLTPSLILRVLCTGDVLLFERAMATLAEIPLVNARILIHDGGRLGLKSIYEKAKLPRSLLPAYRTAIAIVKATDVRDGDYDRQRYSRVVLERVLTNAEELRPDDADYLLRRLVDLAPRELISA